MPSIDPVRVGTYGAVLAGAAWTASGVLAAATASWRGPEVFGLASPGEALYVLALAGTLGGIAGLHARQAPGYGRLGTVGFSLAFASTALLLAGLVLSFLPVGSGASGPAFLDWALGLGLCGALVGFVLLGVATLRLGALPEWCGWLLVACLPLAIALGDYGGGAVLGVSWLALAYALFYLRDVSVILRTGRPQTRRRR